MSPDEFERACLTNNKKLSDAFNGDLKSYQTKHKPVLPRPSTIYDKNSIDSIGKLSSSRLLTILVSNNPNECTLQRLPVMHVQDCENLIGALPQPTEEQK
jgi:hypothetical protein